MTRWQVAPDVGWVDDVTGADILLVTHLPDGRPSAFAGSSALIWRILAEGPISEPDLLDRLVAETGAPAEMIAPTLEPFLRSLAELDLLVANEDFSDRSA